MLYQTAWIRQIAVVFGTSELAIATVLAAYMAGLALGATICGRLLHLVTKPILFYAILEALIAGSALLVPVFIDFAQETYINVLGNQSELPSGDIAEQGLFYLIVTFAVLFVPSACMGATLPMLSRYAIHSDKQIASRVGALYAINTLGGVLGTLATAFLLLPELGLNDTVKVGAATNAVVFVLAAIISWLSPRTPLQQAKATEEPPKPVTRRQTSRPAKTPSANTKPPKPVAGLKTSRSRIVRIPSTGAKPSKPAAGLRTSSPIKTLSTDTSPPKPVTVPATEHPMMPIVHLGRRTVQRLVEWLDFGDLILPLMLVSSMTSFTYEVLWTRLLAHILGGSVAAFATMLASFLAGIAIGSAIASRLASTRQLAVYGFVLAQIGIAACSALLYANLDLLAPPVSEWNLTAVWLQTVAFMLPATLFIGMTFPFAVRLVCSGPEDAARATASVFAWSTLGAIFGALGAGFVLIPWIKFEGTILLAVTINTALACLVAGLGRPKSIPTWVAGGLVLTLVATLYRPVWPEAVLRTVPFHGTDAGGNILYYGVGRSSTVLGLQVLDSRKSGDGIYLRNNGLPEATISMRGEPPKLPSPLATLPLTARPQAKDMLVVGLGGGVFLETLSPALERVDVLELEPHVVHFNHSIADIRRTDPLADERIQVVTNDARNALQLTNRLYDLTISQPSHPWTAGSSHLYTQEFMQLLKNRLRPNGVSAQWMNLLFIDEDLLRSLCSTMLSVYRHVYLYAWGPVLLFLGSDAPIMAEQNVAAGLIPPSLLRSYGIPNQEYLLSKLQLDTDGVRQFANGAPAITDDINLMATESLRVLRTQSGMRISELHESMRPYHPVLNPDSWVWQEMTPQAIDYDYILQIWAKGRMNAHLDSLSHILATGYNPHYWISQSRERIREDNAEGATILLCAVLYSESRGDCDNEEDWPHTRRARYLLGQLHKQALADGTTEPWIATQVARLPEVAHAVLQYEHAQNPEALAAISQLDATLATAQPGDPWFAQAVLLRTKWRVFSSDPQTPSGRLLLQELMAIADGVLPLMERRLVENDQLRLLMLQHRLIAATNLRLTYEAVETARELLSQIYTQAGTAEKANLLPAPWRNFLAHLLRDTVPVLDIVLSISQDEQDGLGLLGLREQLQLLKGNPSLELNEVPTEGSDASPPQEEQDGLGLQGLREQLPLLRGNPSLELNEVPAEGSDASPPQEEQDGLELQGLQEQRPVLKGNPGLVPTEVPAEGSDASPPQEEQDGLELQGLQEQRPLLKGNPSLVPNEVPAEGSDASPPQEEQDGLELQGLQEPRPVAERQPEPIAQ